MTDHGDAFARLHRLGPALRPTNPAELHGGLCGMLCADQTLDSSTWLARASDELSVPPDAETRERLLALFSAAVAQLADESLGFDLLLPAADASLSRRVHYLGYWCRGFLSGLGAGGVRRNQPLSAEVNEFLKDLLEIAQVGFDASEATVADEQAYVEVVEYVRVGVLLVHHELRGVPRVH